MRTRAQIKEIVLIALKEVSKEQDFSSIDEQTNVVKILGLCTDDGIDLACILCIRLECEIPDDVNPLYNDSCKGSKGYERTVGDIIDMVYRLTLKEGKNV